MSIKREDQIGKKRVLVVDDELSIRDLVSSMLARKYIVLEAKDGEEAVHMAHSHNPDLILMDIMMPNMNGYTACCAIKKDPTTKAIPIVMLSVLHYALNVKLAKEIGSDGYITKPFSLQDLLGTVDEFLTSSE
jgi:CheY-like chemotaxis protein